MVIRTDDPKDAASQYPENGRNSTTSGRYGPHPARLGPLFQARKALTVPQTLSIRAPTGGGRNPAAAVLWAVAGSM